jgi:putative restriction endonuclease
VSLYIYPTDSRWYDFLRQRSGIDEVNFWRPGGNQRFSRLDPGGLFLFRLKGQINRIAGGGIFLHSSLLPVDLAWHAFGEKNGAASHADFRGMIASYKGLRSADELTPSDQIGCIILGSPFFLDKSAWLPVPGDYSPHLIQGKRYDTDAGEGRRLLDAVTAALGDARASPVLAEVPKSPYGVVDPSRPMWSEPALARRRLGQGTFRVMVTDAYERRCAVTGERTLPVLEAAHIRPVAHDGQHQLDNGILFRSDIHTLFDQGYVTVTPDFRFEVSRRLSKDWSNGRVYYDLQGTEVHRPAETAAWPTRELLEWHSTNIFLR